MIISWKIINAAFKSAVVAKLHLNRQAVTVKNGGFHTWGFVMENSAKMDDWGYPYFRKPPHQVVTDSHFPLAIHLSVLQPSLNKLRVSCSSQLCAQQRCASPPLRWESSRAAAASPRPTKPHWGPRSWTFGPGKTPEAQVRLGSGAYTMFLF